MFKIKKPQKQPYNFEKARLDYCLALFERQEKGREELEKKSQFYLSLITLSLGALFLNLENFKSLKDVAFAQGLSRSIIVAINVSLIVLLMALVLSLIAILISIGIRTYYAAAPKNLTVRLFAPDGDYLAEQTESNALRVFATEYALAFEQNSQTNEKKARWIQMAGVGIFVSILALATLIAEIFLALFQ
jgi:hypothetical protein